MSDTLNGAALVNQWRNGTEKDNPAGPLFVAGEFAEADITTSDFFSTCGTDCSNSGIKHCC
jgi:Family of unknown function (DUF6229)